MSAHDDPRVDTVETVDAPALATPAGSASLPSSARPRWTDPAWRATGLIGGLLTGALVLALASDDDGLRVVAVALAFSALPLLVALLGPAAVRSVRGMQSVAFLVLLPLLGLPLVIVAAERVTGYRIPGLLVPATVLALAGLALVSHDLHRRTRGAGARAARSPWRQMTRVEPARVGPGRIALGLLLIGGAGLLMLVALAPYVSSTRASSLLELGASEVGRFPLVLIAIVLVGGIALVGLPLMVGATATADRNRLARSHEDERAKMAAHLHDSVLQTLSLVQRQSADPTAVSRLARHQERELRAWLAGEVDVGATTLGGALQTAIDEVEAEQSVTIDATVLGDRPLDDRGEALVAAVREALRNAARHAPGAPIV
ncbi:MAG: hypothetical protein WC558_09420, partial [Patulibacter sp.]